MSVESRKVLVDALDVIAKIAIAVIAGFWALHTYPESREKEFRKSYWDKQMSLLFDATETTAKIATLAPMIRQGLRLLRRFGNCTGGR